MIKEIIPQVPLPSSKLRLDDQLCFALYAATNTITRAYRTLLEPLGLTYPQYLVMISLWQHGTQQMSHIAERLKLDGHAITPLVDRLEAAGLLRRRRGKTDRRVIHIELTVEGSALEAAASLVQVSIACRTEMEPQALEELRETLKALVHRMEAGSGHAQQEDRDR